MSLTNPFGLVGTPQLGRLQRRVDYVGLRDLDTIVVRDDNPFSDDFFNIIQFPEVLTAGKNLFKIKASAATLVHLSKVHIEILDFNDDPVYYEVVKYSEVDGTRVISIWIYNNVTPPGSARIYVGGRMRVNPVTGDTFSFSQNYDAEDYMNLPNALWSRSVTIAPSQLNNTEIIFRDGYYPRATVVETVIPYMQPTNLQNVIVERTASTDAHMMIQPYGDSIIGSDIINALDSNDVYTQQAALVYLQSLNIDFFQSQGEIYSGEINSSIPTEIGSYSRAIVTSGSNLEFAPYMVGGQIKIVSPTIMGSTATLVNTERRAFPFSQHNPGGAPDIGFGANGSSGFQDGNEVNSNNLGPNFGTTGVVSAFGDLFIESSSYPSAVNTRTGSGAVGKRGFVTGQIAGAGGEDSVNAFIDNDKLAIAAQGLPSLMTNIGGTGNRMMQLSGSYRFGILNILSSTEALVYMIDGPVNVQDVTTTAGGGEFRIDIAAHGNMFSQLNINPNIGYSGTGNNSVAVGWSRDTIHPSPNVTMSIQQPYVMEFTPQSQSFASIILSNLEPDTGDIYKVKAEFKPGGQFGDFIDLGDRVLEQTEILVDSASYSFPSNFVGPEYHRIGFYEDQAQITGGSYGNGPNGNNGNWQEYWVTAGLTFLPTNENIPSLIFDPAQIINAMRISPASTFGAVGSRFSYIHPWAVKEYWKVYEGSSYIISFDAQATDEVESTDPNVPQPRIDIYASGSVTRLNTVYTNTAYQNSPQNIIDGASLGSITENKFGRKLGTIECNPSQSIRNINLIFQSETDQSFLPIMVVRRGLWHIGSFSVRTLKETGYTPNTMRLLKKIPNIYQNQPLSFRFRYFDFQSNEAAVRTFLYPVMFNGENTVIQGPSNLLTGSLYISNEVGKGIQASGEGSGYIRSVGYEGFSSASAGSGSGFMLYSGSVLNKETADYNDGGSGMEMVYDSASFFQFRTTGSHAGLKIKTPRFYLGGPNQFLSGSHNKIEISSSQFHLKPDGTLAIAGTTYGGGRITASAGIKTSGVSSFGHIIADSALITRITSSIITASVLHASGSNKFGDTIQDTHIFVGHITASGTISGSAVATASFGSYIGLDGGHF